MHTTYTEPPPPPLSAGICARVLCNWKSGRVPPPPQPSVLATSSSPGTRFFLFLSSPSVVTWRWCFVCISNETFFFCSLTPLRLFETQPGRCADVYIEFAAFHLSGRLVMNVRHLFFLTIRRQKLVGVCVCVLSTGSARLCSLRMHFELSRNKLLSTSIRNRCVHGRINIYGLI